MIIVVVVKFYDVHYFSTLQLNTYFLYTILYTINLYYSCVSIPLTRKTIYLNSKILKNYISTQNLSVSNCLVK